MLLVAQTPAELRWVSSALAPHGVKVHSGADDRHIIDLLRRAKLVKQPFSCVLFAKDVAEHRIARLADEICSEAEVSAVHLLTLKAGVPQYEEVGVRSICASTSRDLADALATALRFPAADQCRANVASQALRVLLAEDNPVNRKLAVRLLESAGHTVSVAENGHQALALYEGSEFDLVLMDVQMPGLSGFECAARIREAEEGSQKRIPILAITAHAMKGAREQCIAAGMDGYLAKPFRSKELFRAISEIPLLLQEPTRRSWHWDDAVMQELSAIFNDTKPRMLSDLESAISSGDAQALRAAAHTLRGSLSIFHAPASMGLAIELERLGDLGTTEGASSLLVRLENELSEITENAARAAMAGS